MQFLLIKKSKKCCLPKSGFGVRARVNVNHPNLGLTQLMHITETCEPRRCTT